jgi:hypothetical protein
MNPSAGESVESEFDASGIKRNEKEAAAAAAGLVSERMALESQIMFSLFVKKNSALVPV